MAITLNIIASDVNDLQEQLEKLTGIVVGYKYTGPEPPLAQLPKEEPQEIKPVLTQERMEENLKNAPAHELPPVPTQEEVREALKKLRDKQGSAAVKELLKDYGADSLPALKEEDYLVVRDRALAAVGG